MSTQTDALTQAIADAIAPVVEQAVAQALANVTPASEAKPVPPTRKKGRKAPQGPRLSRPVEISSESDGVHYVHTVQYDTSQARLHKSTGWTLTGPVAVVDGQPFEDTWAARTIMLDGVAVEINSRLRCRKSGCQSLRTGNNQFCATHKRMGKDAYRQWVAAGKPEPGTDAYTDLFPHAQA